jgi:hypothetical protein
VVAVTDSGYADAVVIERNEDGRLHVVGDPPLFVAFAPELIPALRRGASLWCSIDGDTITMWVTPEPLYYRLTGEVDLGGGLVAHRVTACGLGWR